MCILMRAGQSSIYKICISIRRYLPARAANGLLDHLQNRRQTAITIIMDNDDVDDIIRNELK